jgi:HEAT repeats
MGFYDLSKEKRDALVKQIGNGILSNLKSSTQQYILSCFSDNDTYIRKTAYIAVGRIYNGHFNLQLKTLHTLDLLIQESDFKIRQTTINAAGEIGMRVFDRVEHFFDTGIFDSHHSVRNAVIGSLKKMSEKNPIPVLAWARKYLHHPDKEIRREVCHGIELRGRTHPQDILPLLKELEHDKTARVRNTLVHVLGQIAYKKGCLKRLLKTLTTGQIRK